MTTAAAILRFGLVLLGIGLWSCGGGTGGAHVELSGKTPAEAGLLAGRAVCSREAQCGHVTIVCDGEGAAGPDAGPASRTCEGKISPVPFDDCLDDASDDIAELFACPLSPAQVDMLELCFDTLATAKCVTQAEADARARASEIGAVPTDVPPAACALLFDPPAGCPPGSPPRRN